MGERFGNLSDQQEHDLVTEVWNWVIGEQRREEAAERRHKEIVGKADALMDAMAAGMRAFADALDRARR
jgi:hypothetical protein